MARYEISGPDGARYEVTAPDSMPEAAVLARFRREVGGTSQPQQQPESWGSYLGGLARQGLGQGLAFGFGDEIEARARSVFGGADYNETVGRIRRENEEFSERNPIASFTANLVGGVAPFVAGPGAALARAAVGTTLPRTVGRSATLGAGAGAVSGLGHGEGSVAERLPSAATGAAVGAGFGAALPPVIAGVGHTLGAAGRMFRSGSGRPSPDYEPPVRPAGHPIEGATFTADGAPPPEALGAQEGALRMISDWITSAGGTIEGLERAWQAAQRSTRLHGSGEALNAQTLAELYPPLQRLLRAAASGYREVGEDVVRFLEARQTGILPRGADAGALAQRGIPTRERFLAGRTVQENLDEFGVQLGTGARNPSPTGQLGRIIDETKRLFRIKDFEHHGHAATGSRTSDDILAAMKAESDPAYAKAFGVGDMVPLRPTLQSVLQKWEQTAAQSATAIRRVLERGINQFRAGDKQFVNRLRDFDSGKQALDDLIEDYLGKNSGRLLKDMRRELLAAIDNLQAGNPNGVGPLYAAARGVYARGARDREILEDFKAAWKDDPDEVLKRYEALASDDDRKLARLGIVWGLEAENAGRRAAQDATLSFDVNRAERMLTLIGQRMRAGENDAAEVMRRFGTYIAGEQEMVRGTTRTAIGGSMTDRNLQDALAMGGMEIVQNVQSWSNMWRGSTSLFDLGQRLTTWIVDRAFGLSADRARELSRLLLTANPEEITAIIAQLRMTMPASRMARFNELMEQAQRFAGTGMAGAAGGMAGAPTPVAGGPVSF
jgi:hypothetical protein